MTVGERMLVVGCVLILIWSFAMIVRDVEQTKSRCESKGLMYYDGHCLQQ